MTWLLVHSSGFGEFFPDGTFVDRDALFETAFAQHKGEDADGTVYADLPAFRQANALNTQETHPPASAFHQVRDYVLNERPKRHLGDIFSTEDRQMAVSAAAKDIIEAFEPDRHQFWPISIRTKSGDPIDDTSYFALRILQSRDCLRADVSAAGSLSLSGGGGDLWHIKHHKKALRRGVALEDVKRDGAHLWREARALGNVVFVSDELAQAFEVEKLRLPPKFDRCRDA